jgi:hypothetical protein
MPKPSPAERRAIGVLLVIVVVLVIMTIYGCVTDVQAPA